MDAQTGPAIDPPAPAECETYSILLQGAIMKISCCWLYAISKYGYPPSLPDTYRAVEEMAALGFTNVELEGVREENLRAVYNERKGLKQRCDDLGVKVVNFCPVLPELVHPEKGRRIRALELFKLAVEAATFFWLRDDPDRQLHSAARICGRGAVQRRHQLRQAVPGQG